MKKLYILLLAAAFLNACKKVDHTFSELQQIPELELSKEYAYNTFYVVGDTITLYGRLNPGQPDFHVNIGDTAAMLLEWKHVTEGLNHILYPNGLDEVKLKISAGMGVGSKRPVRITSGGYQVQGPYIDILAAVPDSRYTKDTLELATYYYTPDEGRKFFYCVNGKGSIYLYENHVINVIRNRRSRPLLTDFKDQYGSFSIMTLFSGGVDPQEHYLYFSALTSEGSPDAAGNHIFRFCRYDLLNQQLTTLSRTLFPKNARNVLYSSWQPFEGAIGDVKLLAVSGIYPDSTGNVILTLSTPVSKDNNSDQVLVGDISNALKIQAFLDASGRIRYQYKSNTQGDIWYWDPGTSGIVTNKAIPGVSINEGVGGARVRISPDDHLMYVVYYFTTVSAGYRVYDLLTSSFLYDFSPKATVGKPVLEGPFGGLDFQNQFNGSNIFGYLPLPGERLLILFNDVNNKGTSVVLDFSQKFGFPYAPYIDLGSHQSANIDPYEHILNYDENGDLYLYMEEDREIVKTKKR